MSTTTLEPSAPPSDLEVCRQRWIAGNHSPESEVAYARAAAAEGDWLVAFELLRRLDPWSAERESLRRDLLAQAPPETEIPEVAQCFKQSRDARLERLLRETGESLIPPALFATLILFASLILPPMVASVLSITALLVGIPSWFIFGKTNLCRAYSDPDSPPDWIPGWPGFSVCFADLAVVGAALCCALPFLAMGLGSYAAMLLTPFLAMAAGCLLISSLTTDRNFLRAVRLPRARQGLLEAAAVGSFASVLAFLGGALFFGSSWAVFLAVFPTWHLMARAAGWAVYLDEKEGDVVARRASPAPELSARE